MCVEARKRWPQWEIFSLPIANCAAGLYFHKFVLGVCQPTKVRRQLLRRIETEHKGKAMIIMVMMMMLHMLMM